MNLAKHYLAKRFGVAPQTAERMIQAGLTSAGAIAEATDEVLLFVTDDRGEARALRGASAELPRPMITLRDDT